VLRWLRPFRVLLIARGGGPVGEWAMTPGPTAPIMHVEH
jgi:hypothetical protein